LSARRVRSAAIADFQLHRDPIAQPSSTPRRSTQVAGFLRFFAVFAIFRESNVGLTANAGLIANRALMLQQAMKPS
jgi:hypothetical protein